MVKWNFENNEKSMEILMIKPSLHSHGKLSDFQNNEQNSDYWIMTGCFIVMLKSVDEDNSQVARFLLVQSFWYK